MAAAAMVHADEQAQPRPVERRGPLWNEEQAIVELFERSSRSVVYIRPLARARTSLFGLGDSLVETGAGSGFVWDRQGHIVTNFHVIREASGARVTLPDNTTWPAILVGAAPDKDIAVLRIKAPAATLQPIAVGESANLRVGQRVFAIGNPFGLDFTLTTGVVSALNREIRAGTGRTIHGMIQTDAAINPGNSGGPLLDSAGRLIGMNTVIYSGSGQNAGIGFAVPADTINRVVPQLIAHGRVIRPGLGVNVAADTVSRRLRLGGVLILGVASGSAAERAGLRPTVESADGSIVLGDVIVRVEDMATPDNDALANALEYFEVGDRVTLTVRRGRELVKVKVQLQSIQ